MQNIFRIWFSVLMQVDDDRSVGRWVSGRWVGGSVGKWKMVGGSVGWWSVGRWSVVLIKPPSKGV